MSFGYIYKTTNSVNGKIYVGKKHSSKFVPQYKGSGVRLAEAIRKYGEASFTVEILEWCDSLQELNSAEVRWISDLHSTDSDVGYNISAGGDGGCVWGEGKHPSLGIRRMGEQNPFFGRHHTEETKELVKSVWKAKMESGYVPSARGRKKVSRNGVVKMVRPDEIDKYIAEGWARPDPPQRLDKPYKHSDETKQKISATMKGRVITVEAIEKCKATIASRTAEEQNIIRQHMSDSHKGKAWVHNDNHFLMIDGKDLQYYLDQGYSRGRGQKKI